MGFDRLEELRYFESIAQPPFSFTVKDLEMFSCSQGAQVILIYLTVVY